MGVVVAKDWFGGGVAIEAVDLMLWLLFHQMGFATVQLWAHSGNPRAVGSGRERLRGRTGGLSPSGPPMVGATGFEPATPSPPVRCATKLRYAPPPSI